ncbi:MAG: DUF4349 domain-containing protein [Polyangiaceae bacterium]|nr:DUF4349 domain-containing protein [Polyangiaceae bacterium]
MALERRNFSARFNVLTSLLSLFVVACGASAPSASYAPPSPAYYGGGAAQAEAMSDAPTAAMPAPPPMDSPAPMADHGSYDGDSYDDEGSSGDSGFFGGAEKAPAAAPAAPGRPVAPAARAPMGAPTPAKPAPAKPAGPASAQQKPGQKAEGPSSQAQEKPIAPLLIYTGHVGMEAPEPAVVPATIDKVIDLAESFGGYLAARTDTSVVVRVPSRHFRDAMTGLEKLGEVKRRSVNAEDVSEQYHDLEVRLANLKTVQKRLQEFLAKAVNVNEALQVERELERIGQEIDRIEGRMRFLRARATFSTITVDVTAKPKQQVVVVQGPPPPPPPRVADLPIDWLSRIGLETLLTLR